MIRVVACRPKTSQPIPEILPCLHSGARLLKSVPCIGVCPGIEQRNGSIGIVLFDRGDQIPIQLLLPCKSRNKRACHEKYRRNTQEKHENAHPFPNATSVLET